MVWHRETELPDGTDFIAIPGGFSYGDYLRSGAMAARSPIMRAVADAAGKGVPVIGVCNGFQVLTEAGARPVTCSIATARSRSQLDPGKTRTALFMRPPASRS